MYVIKKQQSRFVHSDGRSQARSQIREDLPRFRRVVFFVICFIRDFVLKTENENTLRRPAGCTNFRGYITVLVIVII